MTTTLPTKREPRKTKPVSARKERVPSEAPTALPVSPAAPVVMAAEPQMADELLYEAHRKITLRCGKSSITLHPNGKIVLRGEYILSDAEGVNRIAGGQIELN